MEEELFQKIYNAYYSLVYRICYGYFEGDKDKITDTCQEVFLNIWQNYDKFRGDSKVNTWIYRITINCCLNEIRIETNYKNRNQSYEEPVGDSAEKQSADQQILMQCISHLSQGEKIIALLFLDGLSCEEISSVVGTTSANVRVKTHRIKEKLHQIYLTKVANDY